MVDDAISDWAAATPSADADPGPVGPPPGRRSVHEGAVVELREVTGETVRDICRLQVAPSQRCFVAPNAVSLAEALFEPHAWFRAIWADGDPVGFLMLYDDPEGSRTAGRPEYFLWRLMIAEGCQGLGYGRRAIELLVGHVRTRPGAAQLLTSWIPGADGPEGFYLGLGFEPTGEVDEGETVARLRLA